MNKKPYSGTQRKLVLALDVGTTFSGISYVVLTPGEVPKISGVNRFPAQENVGGDSKIPSIIYYDKSGKPRAMGAEALDPRNAELAKDEGWKKVEWFKMHLRPKSMGSTVDGTKIPRLPTGKTVVDVFADFLRYLFECARLYISETHAAGDVLWQSVINNIHFILTHPNGWQGPQQTRMRRSAIMAGLIPDTPEGRLRIQFVTEGEASLHFCIRSGLANDLVKPGKTVIIADAGGGTIDISSYRFTSVEPVKVEESAVPECKAQGAVFVTRRAHEYLKALLSGSKYGSKEDIDAIAEAFDKSTKRIFRDDTEPTYVKFAAPKDKDIKFNIRNGQLKLEGTIVSGFFERSIQSIVDVIKSQKMVAGEPTAVFLVGGFAASPWLFSKLQERLSGTSFSLCRPDSHTNKAVADGAISFYLDHVVTERVARTTLGFQINDYYDRSNPEHVRRAWKVHTNLRGDSVVPGAFLCVLQKGTVVSETAEFRRSFCRLAAHRFQLTREDVHVRSYVGDEAKPGWVDKHPGHFHDYCTVVADLSGLTRTLRPQWSPTNVEYYEISADVVILFGVTETQAQLAWTENGVEKRSPAVIVYDDPLIGEDDLDDEEEESDEASLSDSEGSTNAIPELASNEMNVQASRATSEEVVENALTIKDEETEQAVPAVESPKHEDSEKDEPKDSPVKSEFGDKEGDWEFT